MSYNKSLLYAFLGVAIFSTYEVVGKIVGPHIPAVSMTSIRFLIGGSILLPFALKEKSSTNIWNYRTILKILSVGVLNVSISMVLLQLSVHYSKAILAAIIFSSNPVFVGIFSIFFEREKISKLNIFGLIIGLLGLGLIAFAEREFFHGSGNVMLGVLFGILGAIVFGAYTVLSKIFVNEIGTFKLNSYAFLSGAVVLIFFSKLFNLNMQFELNPQNVFALLYLGIIITGIGYYFYFEGLKKLPTTQGAMFFYTKPVTASILAFLILGETLSIFQVMGFVIVLLGVNLERIYLGLQNKVGN